jgi:hypothetical protein
MCEVRVLLNFVQAGVRADIRPTKVHGPNKTVLVSDLKLVWFSFLKHRSQANGVGMIWRILPL